MGLLATSELAEEMRDHLMDLKVLLLELIAEHAQDAGRSARHAQKRLRRSPEEEE